MIETTNMIDTVGIDRLNRCNFKIVFDRITT